MRTLGVPGAEIWLADAEEALERVPRDFDLLIADPPFGKVFRSNRISDPELIQGDEDQDKIDRILIGLWARIKNHRHGYVFGPERQLQAARTRLVWDRVRMASGNLTSLWGEQHVDVWFYAHRYRAEPRAGELSARLRQGTIVREAAPRGAPRPPHPNFKPVRLLQRFIESSSLPGDLVVDPFCGAGSSAVAAMLTGRRYIGIEIDPEYAKRADDWVHRTQEALDRVFN